MNFLSPIWLSAIAAISVPVAIHLWNVRPGRTLKVGSVALIETSSRKPSRSFKLLDLLMLLFRCLLLTIVALCLAMPYLKKQPEKNRTRGWLLIPRENFKEAYQKFKPMADSLINAGYELHYFNTGFRKSNLREAFANTESFKNKTDVPYWSRLLQLSRRVPPACPVRLITPAWLNQFTGSRPAVALNLKWDTYIPADSSGTWIQTAWITANKSVRAVIGTSKPSGTFYNVVNVNPEQPNTPYRVTVQDGKPLLSLKNGDQPPVTIDTTSLSVDLFSNPGLPDAGYLKAALQTVEQFIRRPVIVRSLNGGYHPAADKNWLFWLSDTPLDIKLAGHYHNTLVYESGTPASITSWMNFTDGRFSKDDYQPISLYKAVKTASSAEVLWHDGFGNPLLSLTGNTDHRKYHFYSRFNPSWNDLVWNAGFPQILLNLLTGDSGFGKNAYDRRIIDQQQAQPVVISAADKSGIADEMTTSLAHYIWLLLMVVFFIERWLAHKKYNKQLS